MNKTFLIITLLFLLSCDDEAIAYETIYGCTDSLACNYNPEATTYVPNSCEYIDSCGLCDNDLENDNLTCGFRASIKLSNNSEPVSGAEIFITYNNPYSYRSSNSRASQQIEFEIPETGYVQLEEYDLEDNLISILIDENKDPGYYSFSRNFSQDESKQIAPLGMNVTKLVLEFDNNETLIDYPILFTAPDFNMLASLGETNSEGKIILESLPVEAVPYQTVDSLLYQSQNFF